MLGQNLRQTKTRKLLNVGGNSKNISIPPLFDTWEHLLLDIDPRGKPDIVCDARELTTLRGDEFDAIYCSHNLEHYYLHDVKKVIRGFAHVLKKDGFAYIRVPNIGELIQVVAKNNLDLNDVLYQSPSGPISVGDVIYGYGKEIEESGNDFYAHKYGFTQNVLVSLLKDGGFPYVHSTVGINLEIRSIAFKNPPTADVLALLDLPSLQQGVA